MVLLCLKVRVMAIEIVPILLSICIIYESESSTAECSGTGLATNHAGGRGWVWPRPIQTPGISPTLPPPGSVVQGGRSGPWVLQGGGLFLALGNAPQGRCDTGIRVFWKLLSTTEKAKERL